jgi:hypothetical protein
MSNNLEDDKEFALAMAGLHKRKKTSHGTATTMSKSSVKLLKSNTDAIEQALYEKKRVAELKADIFRHSAGRYFYFRLCLSSRNPKRLNKKPISASQFS